MASTTAKAPWKEHLEGLPFHVDYFQGSMYRAVRRMAEEDARRVAFDFQGSSTTYGKMLREIDRCARALRAVGIREGDCVTIALPNCPQAIYSLYALNCIGAVANMIHPLSAQKEIEFYLNVSQSVLVITLDQFYDKFEAIRGQTNVALVVLASVADELPLPLKVGYLLTEGRKVPSMHVIVPVIHPNRCDNEAFFRVTIDITAVRAYVNAKNASGESVPYTMFQVLATSFLKLIYLRPKMNRFIANSLMYQRNEVTTAFTVKKVFADDGGEALAIVNAAPDDTIESIHQRLAEQITSTRSDKLDKSSETMDTISRMPRRAMRAFARFIGLLERVGHCPKGFLDTDPYHTSVILANLGSIGLQAGYHHLTNWGTNSVFVVIGTFRQEQVKAEDGSTQTRELVDLGITIDERLADGYYYAKTLECLQRIIAHPEYLERPMREQLPE